MRVFEPPSAKGFVLRYMVFSTWTDHLPFAYDLVAEVRPRALAELGVYHGQSYFGFCQAAVENGVETRCYGVDTWVGDRHTRGYDDRIFQEVDEHNGANYASFSTLLRMTFDEAADRFEPESFDIIHLDGLHTYEAVSHDFETWYPKLRPGGIFLFHDIRARLFDFGVWRYWEELERAHETFAFDHGFGLGVLRKPRRDRDADSDLVRLLFSPDPDERRRLRRYYAHAARSAELERKERRHDLLAARRARQEPQPVKI